MAEPRHHFVALAGREIHVTEWGRPEAEPVVLWHGLARTGRDFDTLAAALADTYRCLAPDTLGRGLSAWAEAPAEEYRLDFYAIQAVELCAAFGLDRLRWVGTSMGGMLGMVLAGGPLRERISHLVVNDVGPEVPREAVLRILAYVGAPPVVETLAALEAYLRDIYRPFGTLSDVEWRRMAMTSARRRDDGRLTLHYDPRIVSPSIRPGPATLWDVYERVTARSLVLRGAQSDLLTPDIAARMAGSGPRPALVEVPGCGHAPALNTPAQIETVRRFLAS